MQRRSARRGVESRPLRQVRVRRPGRRCEVPRAVAPPRAYVARNEPRDAAGDMIPTADELLQSLMPPVHPMVNARQTQAMIRRARDGGPGMCEEPDATTWIWSDLHLGDKASG